MRTISEDLPWDALPLIMTNKDLRDGRLWIPFLTDTNQDAILRELTVPALSRRAPMGRPFFKGTNLCAKKGPIKWDFDV